LLTYTLDCSCSQVTTELGTWLYDTSREDRAALPFGTDPEKRHALNLCVRANDSDNSITYNGIVQIKDRLPGVRIVPSDKLLKRLPNTNTPQAKRPRFD
jgi:hypothetical protein